MKACFSRITALVCLLAPLAGFSQNAKLLIAISNAAPEAAQLFGYSVAPLGSDRLVVGALYGSDIPAPAYLLNTNGTLLNTFTNPGVYGDNLFGASIAAVGNDRVLIGAPGEGDVPGTAHLFSTDGRLLLNFTTPTPSGQDNFGKAVAAIGNDRVLIGAPNDFGNEDLEAGAAYLYNTNGTLIATFVNPSGQVQNSFGFSVAMIGTDRVLIGQPTGLGTAFLFDTNGTWLATFTNPVPYTVGGWGNFGSAVAAVGNNHVLISAPNHSTREGSVGVAYLFKTNGMLVTTFVNPTPTQYGHFGLFMSAMGNDRVLIGATDRAYLYNTNGTLLAAFDGSLSLGAYGWATSIAALGNDCVIVGSRAENVYLFSTNAELPKLSVHIDTKPPPPDFEEFGYSIAMVGNDSVLIGEPYFDYGNIYFPDFPTYIGAAYLVSISSGALLTTFTNFTPANFDQFGFSVAAMGSDRVLIGGQATNTAFLYSTGGTLLTKFIRPGPLNSEFGYGYFGSAMLPFGSDRVLVGESLQRTHLFNTNGTLLATFTNPNPVLASVTARDEFGRSMAVLGNDRVLIGGASEKAHLFNTNGTLLFTFTNPTPGTNDWFGSSVAVLGDRVLIGAWGDDAAATNAGAAYLFNSNGTLLTTFTNPNPWTTDWVGKGFGKSLATVGNDRVLIGAPWDDTGASSAGAAYLFNTNGTLLATFTNPTPVIAEYFGWSVAAAGNDRVLVSARGDQRGVGAAYLFSTEGALLSTYTKRRQPFPPSLVVSWPRIAAAAGFVLDENEEFTPPPAAPVWSQVPKSTYQTNTTSLLIKLPLPSDSRFYRLRKPQSE